MFGRLKGPALTHSNRRGEAEQGEARRRSTNNLWHYYCDPRNHQPLRSGSHRKKRTGGVQNENRRRRRPPRTPASTHTSRRVKLCIYHICICVCSVYVVLSVWYRCGKMASVCTRVNDESSATGLHQSSASSRKIDEGRKGVLNLRLELFATRIHMKSYVNTKHYSE